MKPNLYLLGAAKSGTTALAAFLAEHPAVFLPEAKEPTWWASDYRVGLGLGAVKLREQADYDRLYAPAEAEGAAWALDASTAYLMSRVALDRILAYRPDARFMVLLRDPVEMAHAFHMESLFNDIEDVEDFETAWDLQEARAQGRSLPPRCNRPFLLQYHEICSVGSQLERASARIPEGRLLTLFNRDLSEDPEGTWARILGFLDLPPHPVDLGRRIASAHFQRFPAFARLYRSAGMAPLVRAGRGLLRAAGAESLAKRALARKGSRAPLDPAFEARLRRIFAPEVAKLEVLTGRDLPAWKPAPETAGA